MRCVHESKLHKRNCFITLTYRPENLPEGESLDKVHFQNFMKYLRRDHGAGIRFFMCGEYGEKNSRPHYHACLFNFDFDDKQLFKVSNGFRLYTSETLSQLWSHGFSTIGDVNFETAAYVARYVMKKVTGEQAEDHYSKVNLSTGEIISVVPEYTTMSRRPGIGKGYFDLYKDEIYNHDSVVVNGKEVQPPKFYDGLFEKYSPKKSLKIKALRKFRAELAKDNNTLFRLRVREIVKQSRISLLTRNYENGVDDGY